MGQQIPNYMNPQLIQNRQIYNTPMNGSIINVSMDGYMNYQQK